MKRNITKIVVAAMVMGSMLWNTVPVSYAAENKDVICNVGSVSKTYVTTAVLQLVDQGLVDLDEPVVTYLKDFRLADERYYSSHANESFFRNYGVHIWRKLSFRR